MEPHETDWLGTRKAAERMGVTSRTLYKLIDVGEVAAYKFGRVIRVKAADIDTFIAASRIEPGDLRHLYPEPGVDDSPAPEVDPEDGEAEGEP